MAEVNTQIAQGPAKSIPIAQSECQFEFEKTENMILEDIIKTAKIEIAEIDAVWWLELYFESSSYRYLKFFMEVNSDDLFKLKQFSFLVSVTSIETGDAVLNSSQRYIDKKIVECCQLICSMNFKKYLGDFDTFVVDVKVSIFHHDVAPTRKLKNAVSSYTNVFPNNISMLKDPTFSDFMFTVGGKEFKVHKNVLANGSPVFYKMFTTDMKEQRTKKCKVEKIKPEIFKHLLHYIYGGTLPADLSKEAMSLFEAAHFYGVESLMAICVQEICVQNPLKSEPPTLEIVKMMIEQKKNNEIFWQQFKRQNWSSLLGVQQ